MNNKVEELVEWVARVMELDETEDSEPPWSVMPRGGKAWSKIKAKRILSHPDLALIDRERKVISAIAQPKIIPLADALKEK